MPIFTLDSSPEISEVDGKYTVNLPDELAVEATKYNDLNTQFGTIKNQYETANGRLQGFGDLTPESITEMQTKLEAYKETGDPTELNLTLSKLKRENENLQNSFEEVSGKYSKAKNTINGSKIKDALLKEAGLMNIDTKEFASIFKTLARDFAIDDSGEIVTSQDGMSGQPAGLKPKQFLEEITKSTHRFMKPSSGGGAAGSLPVGGGGGKSLQAKYDEQIAIVKDTTKSARDRNQAQLASMKLAEEIKKESKLK